ncbi:MAG: hypothetical protein ACI9HX_001407 [Pseudoalteromonas tetraodonis]
MFIEVGKLCIVKKGAIVRKFPLAYFLLTSSPLLAAGACGELRGQKRKTTDKRYVSLENTGQPPKVAAVALNFQGQNAVGYSL